MTKKAPKTKPTKTVKPKSDPRPKRKRIELTIEAEQGSSVYVAGSFNQWNPEEKQLKENPQGHYAIKMLLEPGEYEYKFIVNGLWQADPNAKNWNRNPFGSLNSVIQVEA